MSKKILILVEGQTEEKFIKSILAQFFYSKNIWLEPVIAKTSITKQGKSFKGGITKYSKIKQQILKLLDDRSATLVSTMIDYYGLPDDFPGCDTLQGKDCYDRVKHLEEEFYKDISNRRLLPYFSLHEFEALLFSDVNEIIGIDPEFNEVDSFKSQVARFNSPEEVNDGKETHPSRRITKAIRSYSKVVHGSIIIKRIGLNKIRDRCGHFNDWLDKLENAS